VIIRTALGAGTVLTEHVVSEIKEIIFHKNCGVRLKGMTVSTYT
jgi:hypothetical protein